MWKRTPISNSNYVVFDRFDVIYAIAKTMKQCHCFFLSAEDHRLYGCNEEYYAIHMIDIPANIHVPMSIKFRIDTIDAGLVNMYRSFAMYIGNDWMMLPTQNKNMHCTFRCVYSLNNGWDVIDQCGNSVHHLNMYGVDTDKAIPIYNIIKMVFEMKASEPYLGEYQYFGDKEKDPLIQEVFANKASEGCKYMRLTNMNGKHYGITLFKNLFNMNKSDALVIVIRDRLDRPDVFQATFVTSKKKSPIPDILPTYVEKTTALFINI